MLSMVWLIFSPDSDRTESFVQGNSAPVPGEGGIPADAIIQRMPFCNGDTRIENYKKAASGQVADYDPVI